MNFPRTRDILAFRGLEGEVWRRVAISTHTTPVVTHFAFLYAPCNSQQAQLVGVIALESLLFPPHGGGSRNLTVSSSSTCVFFTTALFFSPLSLPSGASLLEICTVQVTSGDMARVEEPHVLYRQTTTRSNHLGS